MLLQVLGPVTVTGDNGVQAQFRPRERTLLSVLLLHAGQPCQTSMLADSLWRPKQPRHPEEAVRLHMGRIRQALESQGLPPIVMKMYRAYQADPPAGSLDLHRFRSFLAAARMADSTRLRMLTSNCSSLATRPRTYSLATSHTSARPPSRTWTRPSPPRRSPSTATRKPTNGKRPTSRACCYPPSRTRPPRPRARHPASRTATDVP
jgi:hypothetical protein